ncbi:hypothetical protein [Dehalogenimonas formicexedens]|uniref:hypothetical protein n=1 Tax=Dehalogenimonas formicexedens TaxID=1839801 RepID=UPI00096BCF77|nr:hypothetical protein [Dehalogenimonas formicexedens]
MTIQHSVEKKTKTLKPIGFENESHVWTERKNTAFVLQKTFLEMSPKQFARFFQTTPQLLIGVRFVSFVFTLTGATHNTPARNSATRARIVSFVLQQRIRLNADS